jgi:23S rRNA (uracil1939-C5)-methyltransferase
MAEKNLHQSKQTLTLTIEKLVHGGAGLARINGKTCFVDGVLPGETVLARIDENRNQYLKATVLEIQEASPARIIPPCPVAGLCGGCQWQHIDYPQQLAYKAATLKDCLVRIGKIYDCNMANPVASPLQFRYRSRAALKVDGRKKPAIGFYQKKTHDIVQISDCLLLEPALMRALEFCRQYARDNRHTIAGFNELQLLAVENTPTVIALWLEQHTRKKKKLVINSDAGTAVEPNAAYTEVVDGLNFLRDTETFYQVNRMQNRAMIAQVRAFMEPVAGSDILDLFCGCGNFSLFLGKDGSNVTGLDVNKAAIAEARNNARLNGIDNCCFQTGNLHASEQNVFEKKYAGVLLNPPRGGCESKTLQFLAEGSPSVIVYVSCDPSTLARDVRVLVDRGYAIDAIQPFDMFPHTYHIETIVKLSK